MKKLPIVVCFHFKVSLTRISHVGCIIGLPVAMLNCVLRIAFVGKGKNGGLITKKALRVPSPYVGDDHLSFAGRRVVISDTNK